MRTRVLVGLLFLASLASLGACDDANRNARSPRQRVRKQCFEDSECKQSRHCYKASPDQWGFCDPGDAGAPPPPGTDPGQPPPPGDGPEGPAPAPVIQPQPGDIQI